MIKILYFAQLVDGLGMASESLELPKDVHTLKDLCAWLAERGGAWQQHFGDPAFLRATLNKSFSELDTPIGANDEIAFVAVSR